MKSWFARLFVMLVVYLLCNSQELIDDSSNPVKESASKILTINKESYTEDEYRLSQGYSTAADMTASRNPESIIDPPAEQYEDPYSVEQYDNEETDTLYWTSENDESAAESEYAAYEESGVYETEETWQEDIRNITDGTEDYYDSDWTDEEDFSSTFEEPQAPTEPEPRHFAFNKMNCGPLKKLVGDVEILLVFVSTPSHPWTQEQKDAVNAVSWSSIHYMQEEAKRYGADLNLTFGGLDISIPTEVEYKPTITSEDLQWYYDLLKQNFGADSIADLYAAYEKGLGKDNTPMIFLFNSWDRSHAFSSSYLNPSFQEEFCVIYCDTDMHDNYLTHELMHLYGAIDLYDYHGEGVQAVAEKYFPNSDMMTVSHEIDPLTAYTVGWTDTLAPEAQWFLYETEGLR